MGKTYDFTRQDYLEAEVLQKANAHQGPGLVSLVLFLAIGVLVYLNTATFRASIAANDSIAYGAGGAAVVLLLLNYSPRLIPTLTFPVRERLGRISPGVIGPREFEMNERYVQFKYAGVCTRVGYEGLARVNHNDKSVLFYLINGAVEAVPMRIFGGTAATLSEIARRAQEANARSRMTEIGPLLGAQANRLVCTVSEEDALAAARVETIRGRRIRMRNPITWIYLAVILVCAAGGVWGLVSGITGTVSFGTFLRIFYVLEIPGSIIALLYWFRPFFMVSYGLRSNLKLGRYPTGYLGERRIEWDDTGIAYRYGVIGLAADWSAVTEVLDDGVHLYFYQGETMLLFLRKEELARK
ncbi:MAG: hypothetical protein II930_06310, partial [Lachnospiraceae bacterium]|nr:hypothetical protein [Lachnospiraceae bacterium]